MNSSELFIIKRDATEVSFSINKIKKAISKAFLSVGGFATEQILSDILSRLNIYNGISVEEIQNQIEIALMSEGYYGVAKSYMLYRERQREDRDTKNKLKFLIDYCNAQNPAIGSKYDANANVDNKNIAEFHTS